MLMKKSILFLLACLLLNVRSLASPGDTITVHDNSRKLPPMLESLRGSGHRIPEWLTLDANSLTAKVVAAPTRDMIDTDVEEQLIVEYYSR